MKLAKRIAAGLLCAAAACSFTACKDTTWSYKIQDTTITAGMYIAYQINAYLDAQSEVEDTSKDVLEQQIDGKDASAWIDEKVLEYCKSYVAVEKKFDEMGLSFSDSDKNILENQLENMWYYYQSLYEPNGAGKQSVKKILENSYKSNMIFKKYYDTDGLEEVSEEDLKKELTDNYALVKYIQMPMKDAEGNKLKTEGKEELKKTAEKYVERLNNKENIDDLIEEYEKILEEQEKEANSTSSGTTSGSTSSTASSAASSATSSAAVSSSATSSVAASSGTSSGAATSSGTSSGSDEEEEETDPNEVIIYKEDETLAQKFKDGIFGAKTGVPTIVEDDENYYVTIRYDILADDSKYEEYHDTLLSNLKGDEYDEMVKSWYADYTVDTNADSAKRYKLTNIKFPSYSY